MMANNCADFEGCNTVRDSSVWRDGPAKLFYDHLGIPSDGEVDYSLVLQPRSPELDPLFDDFVEDGIGNGENVHPLESNGEVMDTMELALAVQSILPDLGNGKGCRVNSKEPEDIDRDALSNYCSIRECESPYGTNETSLDDMAVRIRNSPSRSHHQRRGDDSTVTLVGDQEVDDAVASLLRVMEKDSSCITLSECPEERLVNYASDEHELVTQVEWEKDVVWNPDSVKINDDSTTAKNKSSRAGWIPTQTNRKFVIDETLTNYKTSESLKDFKPLFSVENENLIEGAWENEIIWDVNNFLQQNPQPKIPYYDATDEEIVFRKPEDCRPEVDQRATAINSSPSKTTANSPAKKSIQPHAIKSKLLLGKAGFIQWKWQMEQQDLKLKEMAEQEARNSTNNIQNKAPKVEINFNLSNDEYYFSKDTSGDAIMKICAQNYIRHSKVVSDLTPPFITTYLNEEELKNFHRPQLRTHTNAPKFPNVCRFSSCHVQKFRKTKERNTMIKDGHPVLLDRASDLTGMDGDMILVENCEEYPPLLSQVGMCCKIINYYKRKYLKDLYAHGVPHPYGDTIFVYGTTSPFLGFLDYEQILSSLENNMYRAPIYCHSVVPTDFMLIINKYGYFIREYDAIFTAGQQCPLIEVPEPNSTRAKNFLKNFLLVYVYRRFSKFPSQATPRVKLSEVNKNFPHLFESTLKTWLKNCAEIKKIGTTAWVVMRDGFVLPSEQELKDMVTPEQCCAYYSLLAAEQRLKDAGCNSMLSLPEHAEGSNEPADSAPEKSETNEQINQSKLVEELKAAPWNTTSAFIAASKGRCLMQIVGPADPTGCGEGFSYIRVPKKSSLPGSQDHKAKQQNKVGVQGQKINRRPGGTDADLRKLSAKTARDILRKSGLPEKEISKLSRWEVIDVIRTLSTEKVRQGESDDKGITKFSRWKNNSNSVMNQERYKEDCQRVFELQNKILSSAEVLSTDDEDDDENDALALTTQADINQMGKNLEIILKEGKTASELSHEEEEYERLELQKMMLGGIQEKDAEIAKKVELSRQSQGKGKKKEVDILEDLIKHPGRKLKISRTFKEDGKTFLRTEIVRDPVVIAAYLKIRTNKSEEFIKEFMEKAKRQQRKEDKLKEKMLLDDLHDKKVVQYPIVEKMRKKRKKEMETEYFPNKAAKARAERDLAKCVRKCGACGLLGHTRSSSHCPMNTVAKAEKVKVKNRSQKEKRGRGRPPLKRESYEGVQLVKPPKVSKQEREVMKDVACTDDSSSSSDSSEEDDESDVSDDTSSSSDEDNVQDKDQSMVKVDGLKMVLKVPQVMVTQARLKEQEEEEEAARILLSMSTGRGLPKKRVPQTEREFADYLCDRRYKTTAADRTGKTD